MQRIAQNCLFFVLAGLLSLGIQVRDVAGAQCGEVYPGARVGPPPEWTFWADGAACYVRWPAENPIEEEKLAEQCRNTPGARFVHFEPAKNGGQSICIFKVVDTQTVQATASTAGSQLTQSEQPIIEQPSRPVEARRPEEVLEGLEAMVRARNEECLAKERADDPLGAGSCWKIGAAAVGEFIETNQLPSKELKRKLAELQATWIERAGQLEGTIVPQTADAIQIEPSSTEESQGPREAKLTTKVEEERELPVAASAKHEGPDRKRLSATLSCSSATLGSKKNCVSAPVPKGSNLYEFRLHPDCSTGSIAAIGTMDEKGRCVRKVVSLSAGEEQLVESYADPRVVDAIAYEADHVQCYARRHENISCDGKIDYEDMQSAGKTSEKPKVAVKKRAKKQKQASRKKSAKKVKAAAAQTKPARKLRVAAAAETKPVKIQKAKRKKEKALQVTTNYRRAEPDKTRKQAVSNGEKKPTVQCLLFSKLC